MNFTDYINHCKTKIRQAKPNATDQVVDWNAPFILTPSKPSQKGILLIHGLLDSCFIMRELGKVFQERGYLVYAILLPGHGTQPEDLLSVSYQDWIKTVEFGIQALKQEVSDISIAGFSVGATLALHYAGSHPTEAIKKIYCFSPACQIKSKFVLLTGLASWLGKFISGSKFLKKFEEDDSVKYHSMAFNAAWQVYKLTQKIKHLKLSTPLFFASSEQDETVSFEGALSFFKKQMNPNNLMLVFSNRDYPAEKNIIPIRSDFPEKRILCFSHHSITCSAENPYYGEYGEYTLQNQTHSKADYYGNVIMAKKRKDGKLIARLLYNPAFLVLIEKMFID